MTETLQSDEAGLLQTMLQQQASMLQQQTAMLQVHAESVRLQRLVLERLLGSAAGALRGDRDLADNLTGDLLPPVPSVTPTAAAVLPRTEAPPPPALAERHGAEVDEVASAVRVETQPTDGVSIPPGVPVVPEPELRARGARYYQPRPSPAATRLPAQALSSSPPQRGRLA